MNHLVKSGETLIGIARLYNTSLTEIIKINNLLNPNSIYQGQSLIIPDKNIPLEIFNHLTKENKSEKIDFFLNYVEGKKLCRPLSTIGKQSVHLIFDMCLEFGVTDLRMISYILATTHWETGAYGQRFIYEPVPEQGKGRNKPYGVSHKKTGQIYYGRGFCQITWYDNYERFTKILNKLGYQVNLINNPDLLLDPKISTVVLVIGMRDGKFTGADLDDYFTSTKSDWYNARRIINGVDRAVPIKDIAMEFYYIIK
jgi:LysM repeat protein